MNPNEISQEEFELIEAYLTHTLSKEDRNIIEDRISKDKPFALKVEEMKTILTSVETQAMKEQLDVFHKEMSINEVSTNEIHTKVKTISWKKMAIAAVLILSLGSFWVFSGSTNDKLYAEYFSPDPGLPTTMSSNNNYEFYEAMVNYKQGDYKTAISKWQVLQKQQPTNDTINYFIGVAHLANKNEKDAIPFLKKVTKNSRFSFVNDAYYYLGLAYLKTGNTENAKAILKNSTNDNSKALLSELND